MRIEYFLLCFYLLLSLWYIPRISFIKRADLTKKEVRVLLGLKILGGLAGAFYFEKIATNVDYLFLNAGGEAQYELLISDPKIFFSDFTNDIHTYGLGGLFESKYSFWAYIRFNLIYKFIAILNIVTKGNFYFNTIIFSTIVFFGNIAFFRIYSEIHTGNKLKILFACFCLPSLLLYTSCINKDGIVFLCLGLVSYIFYRFLSSSHSIYLKHILVFIAGILTIFLFRNYTIVAIIPAMITALLCKYFSYRKQRVILITYSFFFLLFFLSGFSNSSLNLPAAVVQRKADFAVLGEANTNIPMNELHPTLQSFVINFPQAVNHYLFRPYLWEFSKPAVFLTALELFLYQMIIIVFIFYRKKQASISNFNLFGWAFFINMMLIIGYTIPNIGAIVRYRSVFWIFLICPLLCNTDWKRLSFFRKNITHR